MKNDLLTINEVCAYIGRSQHTVNYWYKWKQENPEHELAKILPMYTQKGGRQTRYWKRSDLWRLIEFKTKVPQGRGGIMSQAIKHYYHGGEKNDRTGTIDSAVRTEQVGA